MDVPGYLSEKKCRKEMNCLLTVLVAVLIKHLCKSSKDIFDSYQKLHCESGNGVIGQ